MLGLENYDNNRGYLKHLYHTESRKAITSDPNVQRGASNRLVEKYVSSIIHIYRPQSTASLSDKINSSMLACLIT